MPIAMHPRIRPARANSPPTRLPSDLEILLREINPKMIAVPARPHPTKQTQKKITEKIPRTRLAVAIASVFGPPP